VVLDADPLVDIRKHPEVHSVALKGRLLDRRALD
jgi:hypothetical protein